MPGVSLAHARRNHARLRSELVEAIKRAREIAVRAANSAEPIPAKDEAEYRTLEKRIKQYKDEIYLAKLDVDAGEQLLEDVEAIRSTNERLGITGEGTSNMSINTEARYGVPLPAGRRFADLPDADKTKTLDDFGDYTRSLLTGETRAQSEGTNTEGGYLVPIDYAAPILDLAVNAMQVKQAGARVIPMASKTTQVGRLEADPVPVWRAEGAAISESAGVFGALTLTAKSLACYCRVSLELMEDANPAFGNVLGTALARAFALEADRATLYGSGSSNQPRGLKNTSGVNVTNFVGANGGIVNATNGAYNAFVQTAGRLKAKNYAATGQLFSPRSETSFASLADTTGQPLSMPDYLKGIPQYVTGQIPNTLTVGTSTDTSDYFVGDWSNLLIGMRTDFRIMPLNETYLVSNGQVGFVGWLRMDVQVARTDAFEILSGVRA
jgi:HK97 family phage major capsid protein